MPRRAPVVRRTISAALQAMKGWTVETHVDGSIDVFIPSGRMAQEFAKEVRLAVESLGYAPSIGIKGRVVSFTTPETLEQAREGRGVHGAASAPIAHEPRPRLGSSPSQTAAHVTVGGRGNDAPVRHASAKTAQASHHNGTPAMSADAILALPWIRALRSVRDPYVAQLSSHSSLMVWHIDVEFKLWPISSALEERWLIEDLNVQETWRKRPLVIGEDSGCEYSCGEVELAARLRVAGIQAYWISEWGGFPHVSCWEPFCVKRSELKERAPAIDERDKLLRSKASEMGIALGKSGGHPDVVAWHVGGNAHFYFEYKGPNDSIKPKQNGWAQAIVTSESPSVAYVAVKGVIRS
jgi:hypothetical protein